MKGTRSGVVAAKFPRRGSIGYVALMPWLVKTEPETYSILDLAKDRRTRWDGVRNYQARNTMRDLMKVGDPVLVYHSNAEPPGVVGLATVSAPAIGDATALDPKSPYHDPKATKADPIWMAVELSFDRQFQRLIPLEELRATKGLEAMALLQRGQRLSVLPVSEPEFRIILNLAGSGGSKRPSGKRAVRP
jgi:predicted RNA-binding protein with PUA-like domain